MIISHSQSHKPNKKNTSSEIIEFYSIEFRLKQLQTAIDIPKEKNEEKILIQFCLIALTLQRSYMQDNTRVKARTNIRISISVSLR